MSGQNGSGGFSEEFDQLVPVIRQEWPAVDAEALGATGGDYERVVALIAERTEHTKALVKRQLGELRALQDKPGKARGNGGADATLTDLLAKLQERTGEIAAQVKKQLIADAKVKLADNPLMSLLMAIGLGIVLGLILRGGGRGRR